MTFRCILAGTPSLRDSNREDADIFEQGVSRMAGRQGIVVVQTGRAECRRSQRQTVTGFKLGRSAGEM